MKTNNESLLARRNQLANSRNPFQGEYPRVLFLCSAGLLRSATAAHLFSSPPYNWNTRTAGVVLEYALNPVNEALLFWADRVYVMEPRHVTALKEIFGEERYAEVIAGKLRVLNIPDEFNYRDQGLIDRLVHEVLDVEDGSERPAAEEASAV